MAESSSKGLGWSWVWLLEPQQNGTQTRLLIRMRVGAESDTPMPPLANFLLDVGGFMMEQRMMQGIALRAEGGTEPAYGQAVEIVLRASTLTIGLLAEWLFMRRRSWHWPLAVGVAAVLALGDGPRYDFLLPWQSGGSQPTSPMRATCGRRATAWQLGARSS